MNRPSPAPDARELDSRDLLENLSRLVPGVIYQYRLYPDGRSAFPWSSSGMNMIYEVTPDEVREDATPVFGRLHPDDYDAVANAIFESARTLQTFYSEFRVVLPRQGLRWRWSQGQPERLPDGGTLWHGIIVDVTERKLAELENRKLQDQLQQAMKMEAVGRLAGGVAHDFNNLLTAITANASLALLELEPSAPIAEALAEITKAADAAAGLTRQLLAFSRRQLLEPRVVDLNQLVGSLRRMLERLIGEDVELRTIADPALGAVRVDPGHVEQVLVNLVVNARDALPQGGSVTIETANVELDEGFCRRHPEVRPGPHVLLAVGDTGVGMSEAVQARLFEPFFTTKEKGKGTGLGLSTIHGAVRQAGGTIEVHSAEGEGSRFQIYLPRIEARPDAPDSRLAPPMPGGAETILVVEDQELVRKVTVRALERLGYQVLHAHSGVAALGLVQQYAGRIDLLLTDVVMPAMNGRELAERLQRLRPALKVLFMSGYSEDAISHHGVLDDGVELIGKPYTPQALASRVRQVLAGGTR